ncbi:GNAT family N-acetyltransferase [Puniceicoccaceae bacterium K14]|nr:GNAT family N-acetyltransferase [Puniceicoccaceae bacterium K14]
MIIRNAKIGDAAEIQRLAQELGYDCSEGDILSRLKSLSEAKSSVVFVILTENEANRLIGWVQASRIETLEAGPRSEILGLVVSRESRQKGIGKKLIKVIEDWTREIGLERLIVRSNLLREESHVFYRKIGFSKTKDQSVYAKEINLNEG